MKFFADFHIHSKYSRATSPQMEVPTLARWAKRKGIHLLGTGDFTHPQWIEELEAVLEPRENGLYAFQDIHFMLTAEVSSIYSKKNRCYRNHNMIFAPSFASAKKINQVLGRIGNLAHDGRPILGLDARELVRIVRDIDERCVIVPAHIWTPWFSLFGSKSGFDELEECFEEQSRHIFCLETGLSSDPAMNWRLSSLDRFTLISNSDSHSPQRIGREANAFDTELSYDSIMSALRDKDPQRFLFTVEFFPEEGKYHFDGHRHCGIRWSPEQTTAHNKICPQCGKEVTVGVMNRVEKLADRPAGVVPAGAIPFKSSVPLEELLAAALGVSVNSKKIRIEYDRIISFFGTEYAVLLDADEEYLHRQIPGTVAEAIIGMRSGQIEVVPGYDGEYGKIALFDKKNHLKNPPKSSPEKQMQLFD